MSEVLDKIDDQMTKIIKDAMMISAKLTRNTGVDFKVVALLMDCIMARSMEDELVKAGIELFYVNQDVQIRFVYDPIY